MKRLLLGIFLLLLLSASFCQAQVPANSLIAYWKLNGNVIDATGNSDGTAGGTISYVAAGINYGAYFNGSTNYVTTTGTPFNFTSGDFSWTFDMDLVGTPSFESLVSMENGGNYGYGIWITAGNIIQVRTIQGTPATQNTYSSALSADLVAIAVVRDGASIKIYQNGIHMSNVNDTHIDPDTSPAALFFGAYNASLYKYDGVIDELRCYNRALSAEEVMAIAHDKRGGLGRTGFRSRSFRTKHFGSEPFSGRGF